MFSTEDTIVAIATPAGRGGIGMVRISGGGAVACAAALLPQQPPLVPRHATFTVVHVPDPRHPAGLRPLDQAVVTLFPGPGSYTGDDVVEISTHGSPVVLNGVVSAAMAAGARLARPGEFTLRAFLNRRIDLAQAEAIADLIDAATPLQAATAFDQLQGTLTRTIADIDGELFDLVARLEASVDFPEEGYHFVEPEALQAALARTQDRLSGLLERGRRGRVIREGRVVVIVGGPNVGKSSLFNALVGSARAIVTDIPGTTRDLVSEMVDIEGIRITLVDTAGLRETVDVVEAEGVARSAGATKVADLAIVVRDGTSKADPPEILSTTRIDVDNKCDDAAFAARPGALALSALSGEGLDALRRRIVEKLESPSLGECPEITNTRHLELVARAFDAVSHASSALVASGGTLSEEFVLADLQVARTSLEEITGHRASDELLTHIFDRFCIGK